MFPHIPRARIIEDLRQTGSPNLTSENILNGELNTAADSDNDVDANNDNIIDRSVPDGQLRQRIITS